MPFKGQDWSHFLMFWGFLNKNFLTQNIKKQANPPTVKKYGKRVGWAVPLSVKSAKIGGSNLVKLSL